MMKTTSFALTVLVAALLTTPSDARSQSREGGLQAVAFTSTIVTTSFDECGDCFESGNVHVAPGPGAPLPEYTEGPHGWHTTVYSLACFFPHGICINGEEEDRTPDELTDLVAAAVASLDTEGLLALSQSKMVSISYYRSAIQVLGCDGESVYGHVPVGAEFFMAFSEAAAIQ